MKFLDELKGEATILRLSEIKGVPREEIEAAIQEAIDSAWSSHDPEARTLQRKIFRGSKPSPALFIGRLANYIRA